MSNATPLSPVLEAVRARIEARSAESRAAYLERLARMRRDMPPRRKLSCGNLAHAAAACSSNEKLKVASGSAPNLGIVTSYNDMLSAISHSRPTRRFSRRLRTNSARPRRSPAACPPCVMA